MRVAVKQIRDFARNIVKERVGERIALNKGDKAALEKKEKKELEKEGKDLLDLYMDHTLDHEDLATVSRPGSVGASFCWDFSSHVKIPVLVFSSLS